MEEMIERIIEKVDLKNSVNFGYLIKNSIKLIEESNSLIEFKLDRFFQGSGVITNECGKAHTYDVGVLTLKVIFEELHLDISDNECFILFHLRGLGKFKVKESKLLQELKVLWAQYPKYKLTDSELSSALKDLSNSDFISYRKSTVQLNKSVMVSLL